MALRTHKDDIYIKDVIRERLDYPTLCQRIEQTARQHAATTTLIEEAGSGIPLLQSLRGRIGLAGIRPFLEKIVRFQQITPMIEAGQVHLPKQASWLDVFKREILSFPDSAHDDQVDAFSQLLNWTHSHFSTMPLQSRYSARGF